MFLVSSCSCLCPIQWIQELSREWRCSWSSADRWCSNYIWVIDNFIAYKGVYYIRDLTVFHFIFIFFIEPTLTCTCMYSPISMCSGVARGAFTWDPWVLNDPKLRWNFPSNGWKGKKIEMKSTFRRSIMSTKLLFWKEVNNMLMATWLFRKKCDFSARNMLTTCWWLHTKTMLSPLLMNWRYHSLTRSHRVLYKHQQSPKWLFFFIENLTVNGYIQDCSISIANPPEIPH